ncbi:hypothetical protein LZ32DRAFT_275560 [Colletotrichum eremochloae]|nr:hypothetical protein LZ32DRAFT_275560 [Colletotrichum eremochloae]
MSKLVDNLAAWCTRGTNMGSMVGLSHFEDVSFIYQVPCANCADTTICQTQDVNVLLHQMWPDTPNSSSNTGCAPTHAVLHCNVPFNSPRLLKYHHPQEAPLARKPEIVAICSSGGSRRRGMKWVYLLQYSVKKSVSICHPFLVTLVTNVVLPLTLGGKGRDADAMPFFLFLFFPVTCRIPSM